MQKIADLGGDGVVNDETEADGKMLVFRLSGGGDA
jgi:hypothetical protein